MEGRGEEGEMNGGKGRGGRDELREGEIRKTPVVCVHVYEYMCVCVCVCMHVCVCVCACHVCACACACKVITYHALNPPIGLPLRINEKRPASTEMYNHTILR